MYKTVSHLKSLRNFIGMYLDFDSWLYILALSALNHAFSHFRYIFKSCHRAIFGFIVVTEQYRLNRQDKSEKR